MVEPSDKPASAESLTWPMMAVSTKIKAGSAISWPKVGSARRASCLVIDGAVVSDAILMSSRFYYAIFIMPNGIIKMKSIVLKNIRSTLKLPQNVHSKDLKQNRSARIPCWPECFAGANGRTRTGDLRITSALLYQLSHVGFCVALFYRITLFFQQEPRQTPRQTRKRQKILSDPIGSMTL